MPCRPYPESTVRKLPTDKFAWGCCIRDRVEFTYIYGPVTEYLAAIGTRRCGDHLHKGECDTLDEAKELAHHRAAGLAAIFAGLGSVRPLTARAYRSELLAEQARN